jgi:hypothetical protein
VERRDVPQGGVTKPLTQAQIVAKLRTCAEVALQPPAVDHIIAQVEQLESLADVVSLCQAMEG